MLGPQSTAIWCVCVCVCGSISNACEHPVHHCALLLLQGFTPESLQNSPIQDIVHPGDKHLLATRLSTSAVQRISMRFLTTGQPKEKRFGLVVRTATEADTETKVWPSAAELACMLGMGVLKGRYTRSTS